MLVAGVDVRDKGTGLSPVIRSSFRRGEMCDGKMKSGPLHPCVWASKQPEKKHLTGGEQQPESQMSLLLSVAVLTLLHLSPSPRHLRANCVAEENSDK